MSVCFNLYINDLNGMYSDERELDKTEIRAREQKHLSPPLVTHFSPQSRPSPKLRGVSLSSNIFRPLEQKTWRISLLPEDQNRSLLVNEGGGISAIPCFILLVDNHSISTVEIHHHQRGASIRSG